MTKEKDSTSLELFRLEEKLNTSLETNENLTSQIETMMASSESEKEEKARIKELEHVDNVIDEWKEE